MFGFFKSIFGSQDEQLISPDAFLVDVRTPKEYAAGSVTGAVNIPMDDVPGKLGRFKDKKQIVIFCRSGNRSGYVKHILEKNGFTNVVNGGTWLKVKAQMENLKTPVS